MDALTQKLLAEFFINLLKWQANLSRAGARRKRESVSALREVIVAARQTQSYVRHVKKTGAQDHRVEEELAQRWTQLSHLLDDLGLSKLAKRCDIKGRYWADPDQFDEGFLEKADISLERIEFLARQTLGEVNK